MWLLIPLTILVCALFYCGTQWEKWSRSRQFKSTLKEIRKLPEPSMIHYDRS